MGEALGVTILLSDFNGHNFIWGSDDVNDKGRIIENFINKNNLCLFNNKTPTYLHPATGTYTSLDRSVHLLSYSSFRLRMESTR